jgi:hypothetical protein
VWKNEAREAVRARCGLPCATGGVPKAKCPEGTPSQGLISLCSWDCEIYGTRAVCYAGTVIDVVNADRVVSLGRCSGGTN